MTTHLPNGVYVGLSEESYFSQIRLGSTDLKTLYDEPANWWYGSAHNPDRVPREPSTDFEVGKALHALVLEGEDAFSARASISPFDSFRTKEAREWRDCQQIEGRIILTPDEDRQVRHMADLIVNHPDFKEGLSEGLSELSVLFDLDGIPMRARFDKLLPKFVVDLKTYSGALQGRSAQDKCLRIIAKLHYDLQRYVYDRARAAFADLVRAGAIYGASPEQADWLRKVADVADWSWVWIFYQKRDDRGGGKAPVVQPIARPPNDITFDTGRRKAIKALHNFKHYRDAFGLDQPWAAISPLWWPEDHAFPAWISDIEDAPQGEDE